MPKFDEPIANINKTKEIRRLKKKLITKAKGDIKKVREEQNPKMKGR